MINSIHLFIVHTIFLCGVKLWDEFIGRRWTSYKKCCVQQITKITNQTAQKEVENVLFPQNNSFFLGYERKWPDCSLRPYRIHSRCPLSNLTAKPISLTIHLACSWLTKEPHTMTQLNTAEVTDEDHSAGNCWRVTGKYYLSSWSLTHKKRPTSYICIWFMVSQTKCRLVVGR